jgi:hypothetical protein
MQKNKSIRNAPSVKASSGPGAEAGPPAETLSSMLAPQAARPAESISCLSEGLDSLKFASTLRQTGACFEHKRLMRMTHRQKNDWIENA